MVEQVISQLAGMYPPVIGISGAQGSGKSTLATLLGARLVEKDVQAVVVSLDDFYLTLEERLQLSKNVHPLCRTRGVPGTHASERLVQMFDALAGGPAEFTVPRFDKAVDDRVREEVVMADCVILEGWCLGVTAQPGDLLKLPVNSLEAEEDPDCIWRHWVNEQIHQRYESLWNRVDYWVYLQVPGFDQVYEWRAQQEQTISATQRMSEDELTRFINHYQRLTQWVLNHPFPQGPGIQVALDAQHQVQEITELGSG